MSEFKVGDKVENVRREGYFEDFENPGTVTGSYEEEYGEYVDVMDSLGRQFIGGMISRYKLIEGSDKYIVDGGDHIYTLYSMAEEDARYLASESGNSIPIAKIIAYAKPTTIIIVERV